MPEIRWEENDRGGLDVGYHVDHATGKITIVSKRDIMPIVKNNQLRRSMDNGDARRRSGKFYEIANIPDSIYMVWRQLYGVDIFNKDHIQAVLKLIASDDWNAAVGVVDGKFYREAPKKHFIGARDRTTHPLASNRSSRASSGGLIDVGAWRG